MKTWVLAAAAAVSLIAAEAAANAIPLPPTAVYTDPPADAAHPARMEVLHIPTAGVEINGLAYVPAGAGLHPIVVLAHGWPGNEKNLDLAQALRRAGWTVVTFNYRGSWGSPGTFSMRGNLVDAKAVLAYVRTPAVAARLQIDPARIVMIGHSMGGWVTAMTTAEDGGLAGAVMISPGDMGALGLAPVAIRVKNAADNMESLAGVTPQSVADELGTLGPSRTLAAAAPALARTPLLVLTADDGLAASADGMVAAIRKAGGTKVASLHVATDHSWDSARIRLESAIITWLGGLPAGPK